MSSPENLKADAVERVVELLSAAAKPLTFGQLKKSGLDEGALRSALETAAAQGRAFRWPDYRRRQYFWSQSAEHAARQAVLEASSRLALSQTALIEQARKRVPRFSQEAMRAIVVNLVAEGHLRKVGAFSAGTLLIRPGETAAYSASARAFIEGKFRKAGLDPAAFLGSLPGPLSAPPPGSVPGPQAASPPPGCVPGPQSASPPPGSVPGPQSASPPPPVDKPAAPASANAAELLLGGVRSMQPSEGVPVTAQRLRTRLPSLAKSEFDGAALELRRNQQVFLTLHHDPFSLPQPERDLLIDGGDGTYYVSIAIR
jgi:hypothetical protein